MRISRRILLQRSAAGAAGLALASHVRPVLGQSTPAATPVEAGPAALVTADTLVPQVDDTQLVAVMPATSFEAARIRGSILLDWADLELADTSEASVATWTEDMRQLVAVRGIRADRPTVLYDEGTLFSARGWWQLAYLGYDLPRVLDGGLLAWAAAKGTVDAGPVEIEPVEAPVAEGPTVRRELLATKDEVLAALDDPGIALLDVRAPNEYAAGHIPGAVNLPYTDNAAEASPHLFKSPEVLREMYAAIGVTPDKRAITYCTTGVRGSVGFFSLMLAGFTDVALYVGSWNEWDNDPRLPQEPASS